MNSKTLLAVAAVAVFIFCVAPSLADDAEEGGQGKGKKGGGGRGGGMGGWGKKCKGEDMKKPEGMKEIMKKCMGEMKKSRERRDLDITQAFDDDSKGEAEGKKKHGKKGKGGGFGGKRACFGVCMMKENKMLSSDGKYDASGTESYVKASFPSAAQADLKKAFDACAESHGKSFSMDKDCAGYQEFSVCTRKAMKENCGWKGGKGRKGGKGKKGKGGSATTAASAGDDDAQE